MMKFSIKGEASEVNVDIKRRTHPDCDDYWDGNWINADILVSIPGYRVSFNGDIRTEEVSGFLENLKKINNTLSGSAELKSMEEIIELRGTMSKTGQIEWTGKTTYPVGTGATLTFNFVSDQSFLPRLISDLELVLKDFPVKGKP